MIINSNNIELTCPESEIFEKELNLNGKHILELGCGNAMTTRQLAAGNNRTVIATEVDDIQHQKNLKITDLPNVTFMTAGAENIPLANESIDYVFMFKSLHHVPADKLDAALKEVNRVLKQGGIAYISEPVFAGSFNDILQLFHNEQLVREGAFKALVKSVEKGEFNLHKELFFNTPTHFDNFEDYEQKVINVTHSQHQLSDELMEKVKQKFSLKMTDEGANFIIPIRVDMLLKV